MHQKSVIFVIIGFKYEEKNKKREYGKNRYHNMTEEKKQRLK